MTGTLGIVSGTVRSDHFPLRLQVDFIKRSFSKQMRIPQHVLQEDRHRLQISSISAAFSFDEATLLSDMVQAILYMKNYFTDVVASMLRHTNMQVTNLRRALASMQWMIERFPQNNMVLSEGHVIREQLQQVESIRASFLYHRA